MGQHEAFGALIRPFQGLLRPFKGLIMPFEGLIRPLKGLIRPLRPLKALKGLYKAFKETRVKELGGTP